jgi:3-methyladenine DNA glycosylase AlkC
MNSTKCLSCVAALVPVACIIGFYLWPESAPGPSHSTVAAKVSAPNVAAPRKLNNTSLQLASDGSKIKQLSPEQIEAQKRYIEAKKRSDEALKKLGEKYSAEYCSKIADNIMQRRNGDYRRHFDSWGLDDKTVTAALGILHDREVRRQQNLGRYFQDAYGKNSVKHKAFSNQTEDLVADAQLSLILGESRAAELLKTTQQLEKSDLGKAAAEISKHN